METIVTFPKLGLEFTINRVLLSLGSLQIYWYGFIIAAGFLLAVTYAMRHCEKFGINKDNLIDMLLIVTPVAIIGARLYYVVFNFEAFRGDFWSVFKIWEGGIAIYGAVIFGAIAAYIYCKAAKVSVGDMFDLAVLGLLIGQFIGRWGNFVNGEAYGEVVKNLPWGMTVQSWQHSTLGKMVHPIFLYESLLNFVGFIILHFVSKKRRFRGEIFLLYVAWYGIGRGLIESVRGEDALLLFGTQLKVSEVFGFISAIVAIGILVYKWIFADRGDIIRLYTKEEIAEIKLARAEAKLAAQAEDAEDEESEPAEEKQEEKEEDEEYEYIELAEGEELPEGVEVEEVIEYVEVVPNDEETAQTESKEDGKEKNTNDKE